MRFGCSIRACLQSNARKPMKQTRSDMLERISGCCVALHAAAWG
jgi:hypothetical protein